MSRHFPGKRKHKVSKLMGMGDRVYIPAASAGLPPALCVLPLFELLRAMEGRG